MIDAESAGQPASVGWLVGSFVAIIVVMVNCIVFSIELGDGSRNSTTSTPRWPREPTCAATAQESMGSPDGPIAKAS